MNVNNTEDHSNLKNPQFSNNSQCSANPQFSPYTTHGLNTERNISVNYATPPTPQASSGLNTYMRNSPQFKAFYPAIMISLVGGMNFAWSFSPHPASKHMVISWFIAVIVGVNIGAFLTTILSKKIIFHLSATLVIISGILFLVLPNDYGAIMSARYLAGLSYGVMWPATFVGIGEICVKILRGRTTVICESVGFSFGFIELLGFSTALEPSWLNTFHGVCSIFFGGLAVVLGFIWTLESPLIHLMRNDECTTIDCLRRLQHPFVVTTETYEILEEHKHYIALNKEMTTVKSAINGLSALLRLCCFRALVALSISVLVYNGLRATLKQEDEIVIGFVGFRWVALFFCYFILDPLGRKIPSMIGLLVCGGFSIGIGIIFTNDINSDISKLSTAKWLIMVFQFFAGLSMASSSVYLTEAFPLHVKPYFIAISLSVEMLVHIVISCNLDNDSLSDYFYAIAALYLTFFLCALLYLPETKKLPLVEAQKKFSRCEMTIWN